MNTLILKPRQALNKAYLKVRPIRSEIDRFKTNLIHLLDHINATESEEHHKNLVADFLKRTWYDQQHFINTKGRNDLVIHNGNKDSTVGVIIEAKKPGNKSEMITREKLNAKAFQELVLYYLRERITFGNTDVRHLIITNIHEWYIFDAKLFDRLFAQNTNFVRQFTEFEEGKAADTNTSFFYRNIAEPFIESIHTQIEFTYFDIRDYEKPLRNTDKADDARLIALFKLLSPAHLLKQSFVNDSNSLDRRFYTELLHIIGLTEVKDGGKKLIQRHKKGERHTGTLLEDTIQQLDSLDKLSRIEKPSQYGADREERLFNIGLELSITWINRILFLKLLEAQLISYHKGDKAYSFLQSDRIHNYDDLNSLFFQVLARQMDERQAEVQKAFDKVPYLNSSLFEPTDLEHLTLLISNLRNDVTIPVHTQTVLKDTSGKKVTGAIVTLEYLFRFLDAYDFSGEGSVDIQEDNKTLINASVLGLIFEKINGYKDGSFFTPGFITMYMCRETIRRAVVQKFNETKGWTCETTDDLYEKITDRKEANVIINSLHICDPAVGSGHFLVSALNEIIAIKSELKVLLDRDGKWLKEYHIEVSNDELIISDEDDFFVYRPGNRESQRVQEVLFHEKQTIIENCLFGVDINPNSVKICRLRLWIELLKHAYYKNDTELETLPNIDINIKCGNSLVSRFAIDADLRQALKKSKFTIDSYKIAVDTYRNAENREEKREMEKLITSIKSDFRSEISANDKNIKKLNKLNDELFHTANPGGLFEQTKDEKSARDLKVRQLSKEIEKLEAEVEEIKANRIYENAFEWRFEFPEVLDDDGDFVGFDVVVANPPYIRQEELKEYKTYFERTYTTYAGTADLYVYFVEKGISFLKQHGDFIYILPNKWMRAGYGAAMRRYLKQYAIRKILDFGDLPVFEEATTYPAILHMGKSDPIESLLAVNIETLDFTDGLQAYALQNENAVSYAGLSDEGWSLQDQKVQMLLNKIKSKGTPLSQYVNGKIFYGIKTGFNEAFVIDKVTRDNLIKDDPKSLEVIKPFLAGREIKRYKSPINEKYLILIKNGDTRNWHGKLD
ncbi:MAG TPA: Eco57I restriction-modification methylase domain-containing protein [Saprospiraceae bacterium]|nr:Eco57I restriction-modification methylase domain-containing protein [Saprospiraceae bacterium]